MNIEFEENNIDIKEIMEQIKKNAANRNYSEEDILANYQPNNDHDLSEYESHLYVLNKNWHYSAHRDISSHRKGIGQVIIFFKKLYRKTIKWYISPIVEDQVEFNANVVKTFNLLQNQVMKLNELINKVEKQVGIAEVQDSHKTSSKEAIIEIQNQLESLRLQINNKDSKIASLEHSNRVATERLRRIERKISQENLNNFSVDGEFEQFPVGIEDNILEQPEEQYEFDYYLFEEYYRGSREQIKQRLSVYMKYFENANYVLDLGCGRGEMTELLLEKGIKVTAVDLNDDMISYCSDRGFPIIKEDIISFVKKLEDNSVDGIFLGQVIEHLTPQQLIDLVNISYKKLKPMGYFIAETPNPQCLSIFTQSFYMDLTHTKPVHAYTVKFILESAGFGQVDVNYLSPNDEHLKLPALNLEGHDEESLRQFNQTIEHWNNVVFGYQDYAVVGRK